MLIQLKSIHEDQPGEKWTRLFDKTWPHYRRWFLSEGYRARPGFLTSADALEEHMPELMPTFRKLTALAGEGDLESRFLTQYCPPPYMAGCSQVVWNREDLHLIRNYDYSPKLFEGVLTRTNWLQPVMGISDCMWGLLDGMNGSGLVVSLTFGGRKITGTGFGIPLIVRYILETCHNVGEATQAILRLPVHMAYNLTVLDTTGTFITAYLSPDRPPLITYEAVGTNHQQVVEWEDYARLTATRERKYFLEQCLLNPAETSRTLLRKFLHPPLYNTQFEKAFGTLYTTMYHPREGKVSVHWPGRKLEQSFENFTEGKEMVNLKHAVASKLSL